MGFRWCIQEEPTDAGTLQIQSSIETNQSEFENLMTLKQACSSEYQGAQGAFKDSMIHWKSAIHITYRISLRSSSMREPRDPLLKVVYFIIIYNMPTNIVVC